MGVIAKITIGKKSPKEVYVPDSDNVMLRVKNESIMTFGQVQYGTNKYRQFFAIGRIYKIVKGDTVDCLWVNFGIENKNRCVICNKNFVRRQISLLKRGWYCEFYGLMKIMFVKKKIGTDEEKNVPMWVLFANALNPWYVPRTMEIKKEINEDVENINIDNNPELINFLDQFKNEE